MSESRISNIIIRARVQEIKLDWDNKSCRVDLTIIGPDGDTAATINGYVVLRLKENPNVELGDIYEIQIDKVPIELDTKRTLSFDKDKA